MALHTTLTMFCEGCHFWEYSSEVKRSKALRECRKWGWGKIGGKWLCKECQKLGSNASKEGIPKIQ